MLINKMNARLQPLSESESEEEVFIKRGKETKDKKKSKNIRQRKESSSEEEYEVISFFLNSTLVGKSSRESTKKGRF